MNTNNIYATKKLYISMVSKQRQKVLLKSNQGEREVEALVKVGIMIKTMFYVKEIPFIMTMG